MDLQEKYLYHQIHPLKLFTDLAAGILALYPLWQHDVRRAVLIAFTPPLIVSFLLMSFANLEKYKASPFGQYIRKTMTRQMEAVRFAGYAVMAVGAWIHNAWLIPTGFIIVLFGWLRGWMFPKQIR
jgi:hypothetical protein